MSPCHRLVAAAILLASAFAVPLGYGQDNVNPGSPGSSSKGPCGSTTTPLIKSFDWSINVGKARYRKPTTYLDMARTAYERNGNLPDLRQIFGRHFSGDPLQQTSIPLQISETQIGAKTFHPSCLFLESAAIIEVLRKGDAGGEFIHQILTDDAFTLVELLAPAAPAVDSGFRVRV